MGTRPMSIRALSPRIVSPASLGLVLTLLWLSVPSARAATNAEAAQKALDFVSADAVTWSGIFGCTACHRHGAALYGLAHAGASGFDLDAVTRNGRTNRENMETMAREIQEQQEPDGSWIHERIHYRNARSSYAAFGLAGYDAKVGTRYSDALVRAADWAVSTQELSGRWVEDFPFEPIGASNMGITARLMTAVAQARERVDPAKAAQYQQSLERAAAYLRAHLDDMTDGPLEDSQRYTFQVAWTAVGMKAAGPGAQGENTAALEALASRLLATRAQGDSPGWGNLDGAPADETSTSLALYALCVAGRKPGTDGRMTQALEWLKSRQTAEGSWGVGTRYPDIPTTFGALALACFGDFSVTVAVDGTPRRPLEQDLPRAQSAEYTLTVRNHGYKADSYTLETQGGLTGWTATLDRTTLELGPDAEATITLTVSAPPGLAPSLSSSVMVVATSDSTQGVKDSALVTTYTNPPPPTEGLPTLTTVVSPEDGQLTVALDNVLSARVTGADGWVARGPGLGVVTFMVAGVTVGTDNDANGDGVYSVVWRPRGTWGVLGPSDIRAVYSGVTLQPVRDNRLGSSSSRAVEILPSPYPPPLVTLCGLPDFTSDAALDVCGYVTALAPGATIESVAFILHGERYPVEPDFNGGFVETRLPLRDGANVVRLVATDTFGAQASQEATVMVDATAPEITVLSPEEDSMLADGQVELRLLVRDWSPVRVETNWIHTTELPSGGGVVTHTVGLEPGANELLIIATDAVGHVTERIVRVWVDTQAPWVATGLPDGWLVGTQPGDVLSYDIGVYAESATQVEVTPGGGTYSVPRGGGGVQVLLPLVPGDNVFTVTVTGESGLSTTLTRTVRYDNAPPVAELLIPRADGTYSGVVMLTARVTDDVSGVRSVAFTRDGSGIRGATLNEEGLWTAELDTRELVDGAHTVEVWLEDEAGNFSLLTFPFSTDNVP
ncbi:Ig-like domain-containing protein [Myxococcus qinghaiensis]|uniref:Ig-like domain-containing protein n=1 Tax=Myxococcus qinghaiensis TaxID=2906758 RepID=UPI0020A7190A|nr:Ig-like domain-containing protein [Myxococcus qinghaiensis]MCP3165874.1 Ig-like domain-containing protein [Myxococcus qinghaiensis]